jgi:CBS domain-containing protein
MFSLYGLSGQNFRGTLEQLSALPGVTSSRHARGIAKEGEEPSPTFVERLEGHAGGAASGHAGGDGAIQGYRNALNLEQQRDPLCHAYQIMAHEVFTLTPELPAAAAWRTLLGLGVRQAPVLDATRNVIGLVTERDLLTTFNLERKQTRSPIAHHVGDVMVSPVVCVDPETDIRRVARAMLEFDLPCVPVVNDSRQLLGLVSRGDILRAVTADPPLSLWV